jgi:hypothetical protein
MVMMKRFFLIVSVALFSIIGCKKDDPQSVPVSIEGQWELVSASLGTKSADVGGQTVSVYVEFTSDGKFSLYQRLGAGRHESYNGTWTLSENILSGKYSDGSAWACDYSVKIEDSKLTLSTLPDGSDIYTYSTCTIPDSVKE